MNAYTVVSDITDIFDVGERILGADLEEWLKEGSLPIGMVLMGPKGCVKVVKKGRQQLLEPCSCDEEAKPQTSRHLEIFDMLAQNQQNQLSLREIGSAFGMVVSHVSYCLLQLEKEGLITREKGKHRSVRLTEAGRELWDKRK